MRNKIIAFALIFVCLFSFGSVYSAEPNRLDVAQETELLNMLGVLPPSFGAVDSSELTRAQFAHTIVCLIGLDDNLNTLPVLNTGLLDVVQNEESGKAVHLLSMLGIVNGDGSGKFNPNQAITANEGIKILVKALGYEPAAEEAGGYPAGYISIASGIGLLKGVGLDSTLTKEQTVKLLHNALNAKILKKYEYGNGKFEGIKKGGTVLSEYLKVEKQRGQIVANEITGLGDYSKTREGQISVEGTVYLLGSQTIYASDYLGYCVEVYYRINDRGENEAIYLYKTNNKELLLEADSIEDYSNYRYTYCTSENGKLRTVSISSTPYVIYNGGFTPSFTDEMATPENGRVRLIAAGNDGTYDTVIIEDYYNMVVTVLDTNTMKVYGKHAENTVLDFSDSSKVYLITNESGYPIQYDKIKANNILSVGYSADKEILRVVVSRSSVSGRVESVSGGNAQKVTVDTEEYEFASDYQGVLPEAGDSGTFYLDYSGKIAYYVAGAENETLQYGFIIGGAAEGAFGDTYRFKLLTVADGIQIYTTAGKVRVNDNVVRGESLGKNPELFNRSGQVIKQLIRYSLNADGKITGIETPRDKAQEDKNALYLSVEGSQKYRSSTATLGFRTFVNAETKVFVVPETDSPSYTGEKGYVASDKDYYAATNAKFVNDRIYKCSIYNTQYHDTVADAVIIYNTVQVPTTNSMYAQMTMVDEIVTAIDEEGEPKQKIKGLRHGNEIDLYVKNSEVFEKVMVYQDGTSQQIPLSVEQGDIIRYEVDDNNEIHFIQMIYDESERKFYGDSRLPGQFTADIALNYGYAAKRSATQNAHIFFAPIDAQTGAHKEATGIILPIDKFGITVYDATGKNPIVRKGTYQDIMDAELGGNNFSEIIYMTRVGDPTYMMVYNR